MPRKKKGVVADDTKQKFNNLLNEVEMQIFDNETAPEKVEKKTVVEEQKPRKSIFDLDEDNIIDDKSQKKVEEKSKKKDIKAPDFLFEDDEPNKEIGKLKDNLDSLEINDDIDTKINNIMAESSTKKSKDIKVVESVKVIEDKKKSLDDLFKEIDDIDSDDNIDSDNNNDNNNEDSGKGDIKLDDKKPEEIKTEAPKKENLDIFDEIDDDDLDEEIDIIGAQKEKNLGIVGDNSKKLENVQKNIVKDLNEYKELSPTEQKLHNAQADLNKLFEDVEEPEKEKSIQERTDDVTKKIQELTGKKDIENDKNDVKKEDIAVKNDKNEVVVDDLGIDEGEPLSINDDIPPETEGTIERSLADIQMEKEQQEKALQEQQEKIDNSFNEKVKDFNLAVGQNNSIEKYQNFEKYVKGIVNSDSNSLVKLPQFREAFRDFYKDELESALKQSVIDRNNGKDAPNISEITKKVDGMMKDTFDYLKQNGDIGEDMTFTQLGGAAPEEIKKIQDDAFSQLNKDKQFGKEKRQFTNEYNKNKTALCDLNTKYFNNTINSLNEIEGVSFNAKGIENYLSARWKESSGKTPEERQELFKKDYHDFASKAYEKLAGKCTYDTNIDTRNHNFEIFCRGMENMCKLNGWMDPEAPHEMFGGLTANEMNKIDKNAIDKLPKNKEEFAKAEVKELETKNFKGNDKNKLTVEFMKAIDQKHASRSVFWKIRHPVLNYRENKAIKDIKADLIKNGKQAAVDEINNNPLKDDQDVIKDKFENLQKKVDDATKNCDKMIKDKEQTIDRPELENRKEGVRITVPEADNIKEIVNPDPEQTSPRVDLNKDKTLNIKGPDLSGAVA